MSRLYRMIAQAAPTCTLWDYAFNSEAYEFRLWRAWRIPRWKTIDG